MKSNNISHRKGNLFGRLAVVAINSKGEVAGSYESITQAARINGTECQNISKAIANRTYHRKHLWMYEKDYRNYWMEGRTDELKISWKEFCSKRSKKRWANMSEGSKAERNRKVSLARRLDESNTHRMSALGISRRKKVKNYTYGEVYESVTAAAKALGSDTAYISRVIKEGRTYKGNVINYI